MWAKKFGPNLNLLCEMMMERCCHEGYEPLDFRIATGPHHYVLLAIIFQTYCIIILRLLLLQSQGLYTF